MQIHILSAEEGLSYYEVVELAHLAPTQILFPNLVMEGLSCEVLELIHCPLTAMVQASSGSSSEITIGPTGPEIHIPV